jgi:hypothetical protein
MFNLGGRRGGARGQNHVATIETILLEIGIDPVAARIQTGDGYGWRFQRGSAAIEVYLAQQETDGYLQVLAPILHLPMTNLLPLYRHLLELNLQLTSAALGVYLDVVYVFSERPLEGLDAVEANKLVSQVAEYADELDDRLVNEFGGRLYGRV